MTARSLPALLEEQAERRPKMVALRQKHLGIWRELTWGDYAQAVREVALGLDDLGVRAGDHVAVFADNDPRWLFADLGIQAVGAASLGVYAGLDPEDVGACLAGSACRVVICGDQEQVDALLDARVEGVEHIVVFDMKGLHTAEYEGVPLETFEALQGRGREHVRGSSRFAELLAERDPEEVAVVALTSGTTASPHPALLSHGGELAMARLVAAQLGLRPRDRSFALLPLAHATARLYDAYAPLVVGSSLHFAEAPDTTAADLAEIEPTILLATPRLLERVKGDVELRMARAGRFKRAVYGAAIRTMTGSGGGAGGWFGRLLVGRSIVAKAGLRKLRYGAISGSFAAPELIGWFWSLGVPMREQYGQVETGGVVSSQRGRQDAGTAGPPIDPAITVRLDDDGELLVRSPGLLVGGDVAALEDGWYRTGDLARVDGQGRIVPLGRRGNVQHTAAGVAVSPAEIESRLKVSVYVSSAMIVAEGRPYVTALLEIDAESVADWARREGIPVTTYSALVANERVRGLVGVQVEAANAALDGDRRVRDFRLLPAPLDRELTPTGKIKRAVVESEHRDLIASMYDGAALSAAPAETAESGVPRP